MFMRHAMFVAAMSISPSLPTNIRNAVHASISKKNLKPLGETVPEESYEQVEGLNLRPAQTPNSPFLSMANIADINAMQTNPCAMSDAVAAPAIPRSGTEPAEYHPEARKPFSSWPATCNDISFRMSPLPEEESETALLITDNGAAQQLIVKNTASSGTISGSCFAIANIL